MMVNFSASLQQTHRSILDYADGMRIILLTPARRFIAKATLTRKLKKAIELNSDILNACCITPHHWTADGKRTDPANVIQPDQSKLRSSSL